MFCSQCGLELDDAAKFCSGCGNQTSTGKSEKKTANTRKSSASTILYQAKSMTFAEAIGACYSKFFEFSGRASRSEYWWFYLFTLLLTWGAKLVATVTMPVDETGVYASVILESVVLLATLPTFSAWVRRLHDIGKSGWNILWAFTIIGIIPLIIWTCREGDKTQNEYDTKKTNNTLAIIIVILTTLFTIGIFFFQASKNIESDAFDSSGITNESADHIDDNSQNSVVTDEYNKFSGAWFDIKYPANFEPEILSYSKSKFGSNGQKQADAVIFRSPDGKVEFYIFSPQWGGDAPWIDLNSKTERIASKEIKKSQRDNGAYTWVTIQAKDGSYSRSYQEFISENNGIHWVVGIKYASQSAFNDYRKSYLFF